MLGPQGRLTTTAVLRWARVAGIVKAIDNVALLEAAPSDAILVFRHFLDPNTDWLAQPSRFVEELLAALGGFRAPGRLYVETLNEVGKGDLWRYIAFLELVVPRLHAAGLLVIGPSWGSGDYEAADWQAFRDVGWCGLDGIGLHAYWSELGPTVWNGLRWRTYYEPKLDRGLPIFITECGRDRVRDGAGGTYVGTRGWRLAGISADTYAGELVSYAKQLLPNEYATPFLGGPTADWTNYDTDPVADLILAGLGVIPVSDTTTQSTPAPKQPPQFHLGFADLAAELGRAIVGDPVEDEHYWPDGSISVQTTTRGVMWYSKVANQARFLPFV